MFGRTLFAFFSLSFALGLSSNIDVHDDVQSINRTAMFMVMPPAASDLQCLRELPVEQLLRIRKSLHIVTHMMDASPSDDRRDDFDYFNDEQPPAAASRGYRPDGDLPYVGSDGYTFDFNETNAANAQPLIMDKIKEKVGYDDGVEEKPSKVQKIFQISVTSLAFLAFGGYLLCMIVQAIKSKGTTYYHPAYLPMTTAPGAPSNVISSISYKKRRPVRYRRAATKHDDSLANAAGPSPDDLYKILVLTAEGYVNLSQLK